MRKDKPANLIDVRDFDEIKMEDFPEEKVDNDELMA